MLKVKINAKNKQIKELWKTNINLQKAIIN